MQIVWSQVSEELMITRQSVSFSLTVLEYPENDWGLAAMAAMHSHFGQLPAEEVVEEEHWTWRTIKSAMAIIGEVWQTYIVKT